VSLAQARSIAASAAHGAIVAQELEKESGGSGLRYSFEVKSATGLREVGVDAKRARCSKIRPIARLSILASKVRAAATPANRRTTAIDCAGPS